MLLVSMACTSPVSDKSDMEADLEKLLVWPAPPETPRIRYLHSFREPKDLGIGRGLLSKLVNIFTGKPDRLMLRPYAVAADEEIILIADPGLHAVLFLETGNNKYHFLDEIARESLVSPVGLAITDTRLFIADSTLGKVFILDRRGKHLATIEGVGRPTGLAFHRPSNRLYIADTQAHKIYIYGVDGRLIHSFGGRGNTSGKFNYPTHLTVHGNTLYVNDTMNYRIQAFDLDGEPLTAFGELGDGSGQFAQSKGVGTDSEGHIYVADALSNYVQIFDEQGNFLLAFGGEGYLPGQFRLPSGLYIDRDRIYVADSFNQRIQVFQFLGEKS